MADLLNDIDTGILIIDNEDRISLANNFLISRDIISEDWENKKYYEVIRSLDLLRIISEVKEGNISDKEFRYKGSVFSVKADTKEDLVLLINDVSFSKRFEEQAKEFLAAVSHELSTPVSAVKGLLETMELKKTFDEILLRKAITRIEEIERIIDSIRYLLLIDKEEGKVNRDVDIKDVIIKVKDDLSAEAKSMEVDLELEMEENIKVKGDREKFYILFRNILENAIKYNRRGGKVKVMVSKEGDIVKIEVSDTGTGIPKEDLPFIFMPFFGGKSKRGMGLGLALCEKIAKLYNIKIEVESEEGKGSKFILEFGNT